MDDLQDVSRALEGVLSASDDPENLTVTVERYLQSIDPSVRALAVSALHDTIVAVDEDHKRLILEDTALTYIPLLVPLVSTSRKSVIVLVEQIAKTGRPREVVLALNEVLQDIEERCEGVDVSDEDDDLEGEAGDVDYEDLLDQFDLAVRCYTIAMPRLANNKSTPTLLALSDALSSVLPVLAPYTGSSSSHTILSSLCKLLDTTAVWVDKTSDRGGEQRAILTQLHSISITLLSPHLDASLFERAFLVSHPKFANLPSQITAPDDHVEQRRQAVAHARETAITLGMSTDDLVDRLIRPSSISPHSALAALTLLASSPDPLNSQIYLADCMPILSAALSSSAIDAGLAWLWILLQSIAKSGLDFDPATMLLELLTPLASHPPTPTARTALFKLISSLIAAVEDGKEQILLFYQVLEPANPFDNVRVQTLTLLREAICDKNRQTSILIPFLLDQLSPLLFGIPNSPTLMSQNPTAPLELSINDLLASMWPAWFTECASLFRVWLSVDHGNATGIRDKGKLGVWGKGWLGVLKDRIDSLKRETSGDGLGMEGEFVVVRWEDAVDQAVDMINTCRK